MRYWAHERDLARLGERHDGDGAGVAHHVADGHTAVGQLHAQAVHVEDAAGPGHVLGERALGEVSVARVVVAEDEVALLGRTGEVVQARAVAVVGEGPDGLAHVVEGRLLLVLIGIGHGSSLGARFFSPS